MEQDLYKAGDYFGCLERIYRLKSDGYDAERLKALCWLGLAEENKDGRRVFLLIAKEILERLALSKDFNQKVFAYSKLVLVLWKLGEIESLDSLYEEVKSSELSGISEIDYSMAVLALWQGDSQGAIELSRRIDSEMEAEAHELRGDAYASQGYPSDAKVEYMNAIRCYHRYCDIERVQEKLSGARQ